jgi:hypothetical protein
METGNTVYFKMEGFMETGLMEYGKTDISKEKEKG